MRRRRRWPHVQGTNSLEGHRQDALRQVSILCGKVAASTINTKFTTDELLGIFFDREVLDKSAGGAEVASDGLFHFRFTRNYKLEIGNLLPSGVYSSVVNFDFEGTKYLPISEKWCRGPLSQKLLDTVAEIAKVHVKFAAVNNMVDWLDRHATLGAIRHYWPTMMQLIPKYVKLAETGTERFKEPENISGMLADLRETAATVASAAFATENDWPIDGKVCFNLSFKQPSWPDSFGRLYALDRK